MENDRGATNGRVVRVACVTVRRMDLENIGELRVYARGGVDRAGGGNGPAILLCHGFGAPGNDLVNLARVIDVGRETRWFFPEAPLEVAVGPGMLGRAWWDIGMDELMMHLMRGDIAAAIGLREMMSILVAGNPDAFIGGNPNLLRAGAALNRLLHSVAGHVGFFGLGNGQSQPRVAIRVAA